MGIHTIKTAARGGEWIAYAVRDDTGERFGIEVSGATEAEASSRLERWLEWQQAHAAALDALQRAEQAYHRTIAGSAFTSPTEGPLPIEIQKDALDAVEAARRRLDEIRAKRPDRT
jgi:hypothetical protein